MTKHFIDLDTNDEFEIDFFLATGHDVNNPVFVQVCEDDFKNALNDFLKFYDGNLEEKNVDKSTTQIIYYAVQPEDDSYRFIIGYQFKHKLEGSRL